MNLPLALGNAQAIRCRLWTIGVVLLVSGTHAFGQADCKRSYTPPDTSWLRYNRLDARFDVGVVQGPEAVRGTWSIVSASSGNEITVAVDMPAVTNPLEKRPSDRGSVMRIGHATLVKDLSTRSAADFGGQSGMAIVINSVAMSVLERAFPRGPASIDRDTSFAIDEKREVLCVQLTNTQGVRVEGQAPFEVSPPWTSRGSVRRVDSRTIAFRLRFIDQSERSGWVDIKWDFELEGPGAERSRNPSFRTQWI